MTLPQHALVIRRAETDARKDAEAILLAARQLAGLDREQAREQGFREGMAAGVQAAAALQDALQQTVDSYWAEHERDLVEVALAIAHRVVAHLPPEDQLRGIAETALAEHRQDVRLALHADPATAEILLAVLVTGSPVEVRADPAMAEGRIVLKHPGGQTELGLLDQFRVMVAQAALP